MNLYLIRVLECDEQLETCVETALKCMESGRAIKDDSLCILADEFLESEALLGRFMHILEKRKRPHWLSVRVLQKLATHKLKNPGSLYLDQILTELSAAYSKNEDFLLAIETL